MGKISRISSIIAVGHGRYSVKNLHGFKFGRLTVMAIFGRDNSRNVLWIAQCSCGEYCTLRSTTLLGGHTKSCGCLQRDVISDININSTDHGHSNPPSPTYHSWVSMKTRCLNPKHEAFDRYGGRGITVCDRWLCFENFLNDMGVRPIGKTLDRRDNDLGYFKENCRWATPLEQTLNRRCAA